MDAPSQTVRETATLPDTAADRLLDLVERRDPRVADLLAEEPARIAALKLLFFTTPDEYRQLAETLRRVLHTRYVAAQPRRQLDLLRFALEWTDSLNSPVDLDHNLANRDLHAGRVLSEQEVRSEQDFNRIVLAELAQAEPEIAEQLLADRCDYAMSVNSAKGQNLFRAWAERWQTATGRDPFASLDSYLDHRAELFARGNYYTDLYFSRRAGTSITQFFNDYGEQADDCRRVGSAGGTTNPVIATFGEDDLPAKWGEARRKLAERQQSENRDVEWAATAFTELVVFNAQLGQRGVFLLEGLGRISFQLRTDKADDADYLLAETPEIYARLCDRLAGIDAILLEGADPLYRKRAGGRLGVSNNHFKVSVSGPVALRLLREMNAGNNRLNTRLYTNATVTHDLSQIVAALDATQQGIADWQQKTGEPVVEDDGDFGSVVTSMMGRYVDGMRGLRIRALLDALGSDHPLHRALADKVTPKSSLAKPPLNDPKLVAALAERGVDFRPEEEEDAVRNIATLITKKAVHYAETKYGPERGNRILSASKRFFAMNTDLENEVRYATDFGDIQAQSLEATYQPNPARLAGLDPETGLPREDPDSFWWRRLEELRRIFPDAERYFTNDGIPPEQWIQQPYNAGTMKEFTKKWWLCVDRARLSVELLEGKHRGKSGLEEFAKQFYGHLGDQAVEKTLAWARGFFSEKELAEQGWGEG